MESIDKYQINGSENIRTAAKKMDSLGVGFIAVIDNNSNIIAILTDGDFRRAILSGISLEENVLKIANHDFKFVEFHEVNSKVSEVFSNTIILQLPVLRNGKLVDIKFRNDYIVDKNKAIFTKLDMPVVIMAGGKGTRLAPFTDILPKPLIPIGDKTIIEVIMEEYARHGISKFYISVNYKAKLIKAYFEDTTNNFKIKYIEEMQPLGTAGSLKLIENIVNSTFFVSNCDILIKEDYSKILEFHKKGKFELTLVGSMQHIKIPYGVCKIDDAGNLKEIIEKPEYDHLVNTGMYVIEPEVLKLIPKDKFYNITDLMDNLLKNGRKVGVFPVSEKSYIDTGQWEEYKKALKMF